MDTYCNTLTTSDMKQHYQRHVEACFCHPDAQRSNFHSVQLFLLCQFGSNQVKYMHIIN